MRRRAADEIRRAEEPPTRESFHLAMAHRAYLAGRLTVDQLEESVAHVLAGGHLTAEGRPA